LTQKLFKVSVILIGILSATQPVASQTIHNEDLDFFIARLKINHTDSGNYIDCCDFFDWYVNKASIDTAQANHYRRLSSIPRSKDLHLLANWDHQDKQGTELIFGGSYDGKLRKYWWSRWFILHEDLGYEYKTNLLTVWTMSKKDSLDFHCAQMGPFNTSYGGAEVRRVTAFPDSSFLVVVEKRGELHHEFNFLRGLSPCDLEIYYSKVFVPIRGNDIARGPSENVFYNFEKLYHPNYQISEVTEYGHYISTNEYLEKYTLDSTNVKTLNLWEMAKEYFKIDSANSK